MAKFQVNSDFQPTGDQPTAISQLVDGITGGLKHQTLLGATGTGKTYTIAKLIIKLINSVADKVNANEQVALFDFFQAGFTRLIWTRTKGFHPDDVPTQFFERVMRASGTVAVGPVRADERGNGHRA